MFIGLPNKFKNFFSIKNHFLFEYLMQLHIGQNCIERLSYRMK